MVFGVFQARLHVRISVCKVVFVNCGAIGAAEWLPLILTFFICDSYTWNLIS